MEYNLTGVSCMNVIVWIGLDRTVILFKNIFYTLLYIILVFFILLQRTHIHKYCYKIIKLSALKQNNIVLLLFKRDMSIYKWFPC